MADLKTNYKDDVLDTSKNEKRKFRMIQNDDGTVSFEDASEYTQEGDSFGSADINATNGKVNEINESLKQESKKVGTLTSLTTTIKTSIVNAINSLVARIDILENVNSCDALFSVGAHGALATSAYYTLTSITKNFGSDNIYVDKYGAIIFKLEGHYMLDINLVLDKSFTSTSANISVHRYDSKGGSDTLIAEEFFYAANNAHSGHINILVPVKEYGFIKIFGIGKIAGGYISLHRVA